MVNELQSQEWAYLLDPCFQLVNTNGKPLTNGHIEVFYHGTRTPYYCASDWNGTLHPFKIKIDSLGSNVVLADPKFSYDVYVYNAYGVLQMSRYNVNPGVGGSGGSSISDGEAPHWNSDPNGGASSSVTGGTTVYLTLPSSEDQPEFVDHSTDTAIFLKGGLYHIDAVVSFKQDEEDLQNIIKDLVVNTGLMGWDAQMTGQKNWTGPESTDDDRHFLELHTVVSVPEDLLQPLYFQISSPVDLDSAAIEKLDIVKLTAGGGGMTYAAGYGIDITGPVISVSGMIPEASAANFVDVSTYNTDIENIYETIAETSAMIPSGVATEQFVEDFTSAFITEDALDGYATQQWVEDQHYITSADIPPIPQDVVTSGELATVSGDIVSQIPSLDGYATQNWVQDQGYLTSVPEEYVTQTEMENYTSAFITSADIPDIPEDVVTSAELASTSAELESMIPSLDGYATEQYVQDYTSAFVEDNPYFGIDDSGYAVRITEGAEHTVGIGTWNNDAMVIQAQLEDDVEYTINCSGIEYVELWEGTVGQYTNDQANAIAAMNDQVKFRLSDLPVRSNTGTYCLWFLKPWGDTFGNTVTMSYEDNVQTRYALVDQIPSVQGLASEQYVQDYTSAFITSADIPDVPADVVTSGQLATVSAQIESDIPNYTATLPIAIDDSKNISLKYGSTLSMSSFTNTDTATPNDYQYMYLEFDIEPIEADTLSISASDSLTISGTAGNHVRLRLIDGDENYINSNVNLIEGGAEITLDGTSQTIYSFSTTWGSSVGNTWGNTFDFSEITLSDLYSQGGVMLELWEYNGDTPVRAIIGSRAWPSGYEVQFNTSRYNLNVANPLPSPGNIPNYVLTSNGTGGSYWAPAQGGSSYNGVYPIKVSSNTISLDHDSTLSNKQSSVISAKGEENGYGGLDFMPYAGVPSDSSPCKIQGSTTVQVTGTSDNTVRLRLFSGSYPYMDMISDLVDEYGEPIYLSGYPDDEIQIQTNDSTWASLFDFSQVTIEDLWDAYPSIQLWEYNGDTPVRALIADSWPTGFNIDFGSTSTTFGVTDPLPASTSSDNGKVLTVVSGAPAWVTPSGGGVSEVDIIPSLQTGTKIADYVIDGTSGELYAPNGGSTYTAGDNISIVSDTISVSGTTGLIAGENISITASGDNYIISSTGGGGGVEQVYHDGTLTGDGTQADPLSITSASNWTQAYDAINASAASWNDAAAIVEYPISAGPGMSIEDVSGVTVFSTDVPYLTEAVGADETVIYDGKLPNLNSNLTLSESWNNFKQIRVRGGDNTPEDHYYSSVSPSKAAFKISWAYNWMNEAYLKFSATSDPKVWTYAANTYVYYKHTDNTVYVTQNDTVALGSACNFKVVGIGRISGGN